MKANGLTLLELLITLAIVVTCAVLASTGLLALWQKNEKQVLGDELTAILSYAKDQALARGQELTLRPKDKEWSEGFELVQSQAKTQSSKLLYQWQWNHPGWRIAWAGSHSNENLIFASNPSKAMINGRFILDNPRTQEHLELVLNRIGRLRLSE